MKLACDGTIYSYWEGSHLMMEGLIDLTIRIPPVPEGTYEIRLGFQPGTSPIQFYFDGKTCGIPVQLATYNGSYNTPIFENLYPETWSITNVNEDTRILDKTLKEYGIMRGPDSFKVGNFQTLRESTIIRYCVSREYLASGVDHYLRIKVINSTPDIQHMTIDFLELCPESVYGNSNGEDAH